MVDIKSRIAEVRQRILNNEIRQIQLREDIDSQEMEMIEVRFMNKRTRTNIGRVLASAQGYLV